MCGANIYQISIFDVKELIKKERPIGYKIQVFVRNKNYDNELEKFIDFLAPYAAEWHRNDIGTVGEEFSSDDKELFLFEVYEKINRVNYNDILHEKVCKSCEENPETCSHKEFCRRAYIRGSSYIENI